MYKKLLESIHEQHKVYTEKKAGKFCDMICTAVFSMLISLALVLGMHIQMYDTDSGVSYQITSYTRKDIVWFILMMCASCFILIMGRKVLERRESWRVKLLQQTTRVSVRKVLVIALVLFASWIPYLYIYYPGFIFNDSRSSLWQSLGQMQLNNHFPVMYTLFIKCCLRVGMHLGSLTMGVAVYSVMQMIIMAGAIGYFISWMQTRFSLKKWLTIALTLVFALSRYIAQYSIAMWKDPIFSVAVMLVTVWLMDLLFTQGGIRKNMKKMLLLFVALEIMILSRNNGFYIALATLLMAMLGILFEKNKQAIGQIIFVVLLAIVCSRVVTGPIYASWGVSKDDERTESYGIFLTQMVRVVVLDGNLSDEDLEYMNRILPLEEYAVVYRQDCIDSVKWSEHYNGAVLGDNFFKHYFSILKKNPRICFEAWELQTFGFWSMNQKQINNFDGNIVVGVLRNIQPDGVGIEGITTKPVDDNSMLTKLFPYTARCIPIAYIHWLLIGLALFAIAKGDWKRLIVLAPALGLMATLILASPISYWPRYGLAQQLLLPLFIVMIFLREGEHQNGQNCSFNTLLQ